MSTFPSPRPVEADLDISLGMIDLRAGDRDSTEVEVGPSDPANDDDVEAAGQVQVDFTDGRLVVRGPKRAGMLIVRSWLSREWGGSVDVTVALPTGSSVKAKLGAGDLHADGRLGDVHARTGLGSIHLDATGALDAKSGAGDLTVGRVTGHADVTAASGRVDLGELAGSAVLKNSNGTTRVGTSDGHLRVKAANGAIEVGRANGDVVAKSANGNVRVDQVTSGEVVLETHVGDVEVGIPEGSAAWLDLDATAGQIDNQLTTATQPGATTDKVQVRARTTLGRITVRRPEGADHA